MIYLMGNKADLIKNEANRKVYKEHIIQFMNANSNIIKYFECSAKTKYNLVEPFEDLCIGKFKNNK